MDNIFYSDSKIDLTDKYIVIKYYNKKINYQDVQSIDIKYAKLSDMWLFLIIGGLLMILVLAVLAYNLFQVLFLTPTTYTDNSPRDKSAIRYAIFLLFVCFPYYILVKIRKYYQNYLVLIIKIKHDEFRLKVSELTLNENQLKDFFESKNCVVNYDLTSK